MYAPLLFVVATFAGGTNPQPPAPTPQIAAVAPAPGPATSAVQAAVAATPAVPIHDGRPQEAAGQTVEDATTIPDDGFGFAVETGPAEIARLGGRYDVTELADVCGVKPWLCE